MIKITARIEKKENIIVTYFDSSGSENFKRHKLVRKNYIQKPRKVHPFTELEVKISRDTN
jgi:hypothetical protein